MAIPNGLNPTVEGPVKSRGGFDALHGKGVMITAVQTVNSTNTAFFGATNTEAVGQAWTITSMFVIGLDTTAATITLAGTQGTIASAAKGTSAGLVTGATNLANNVLALTDTVCITTSASQTSGNAIVVATYKVT